MKRFMLALTALSSGCIFVSGLLSQTCGDGFIDPGELCDTDDPEAGCESTCNIEARAPKINGASTNNANFAIFNTRTDTLDTSNPPDGVIDLELEVLQLIISDQADLCAQFEGDGEDTLGKIQDLQAIKIDVLRRAPIGQSQFIEGETLASNDGLVNTIFGFEADSIFVGATVIIREGGIDQVLGNTPPFALNDGVINLIEIDDTLKATVNVTMTAEQIVGPFDAQSNPLDNIDVFDIRTINAPVSVSVQNVSRCAAL
jgi:hypothetical protein